MSKTRVISCLVSANSRGRVPTPRIIPGRLEPDEPRTPLTPIVATMSDSQLISLAPEPLLAALHTARRNLDLEVRLIDDLLDVTRISRGRLQLTHEQIDLHQVIQEVIDMLSVETQRRGITVVTAFDAPQHLVVGDPVRLRQVFWNLLGNATKFTERRRHRDDRVVRGCGPGSSRSR